MRPVGGILSYHDEKAALNPFPENCKMLSEGVAIPCKFRGSLNVRLHSLGVAICSAGIRDANADAAR